MPRLVDPSNMPHGKSLVGKGLTAEVHAWDQGRVVKIFAEWVKLSTIEREFNISRVVRNAGVAAPEAFEIVQLDRRTGIVYERIDGISLFDQVQAKPWTFFQAARQLAELHAELHQLTAPVEMPTQRQQIEGWIAAAKSLTSSERNAALDCLTDLKDGDAICHGDFHPENILLTRKGPVIIDWSAGSRGDPFVDVARTAALIETAALPDDAKPQMRLLLSLSRRFLLNTYLARYVKITGGTLKEIRKWQPAQLAASAAWRANKDM